MRARVHPWVSIIAATTVVVVAHAPASAQLTEEEPLVPPLQGTEARVSIDVNASSGDIAAPIVIAPDVFYGTTRRIALGLTHSARAQTGFLSGTGAGLCVTSASCDRLYSGPGLVARVRLASGSLQVATDIGVIAQSLYDPRTVSLKLGFLLHRRLGRLSLWASPNMWVAILGRNHEPANVSQVHVPLGVRWRFLEVLEVGLESGVRGALDDLPGEAAVPVASTLSVDSTRTIRVGIAFGFDNLVGSGGGVTERVVTVFASSAL